MNPLLFHDDPLLLEFDARVVEVTSRGGRRSIVLDRTAFYPESGGQMADRGVLAGHAVVDVQLDDAGCVHHVLDVDHPDLGAPGSPGTTCSPGDVVRGSVERERRRAFMALHTGQHVFSRALIEIAGAETASSRLGETSCTVDLAVARLDESALAKALDLTRAVIDDDLPVRVWFPELPTLPLRRAPSVTDNVRVVAIGDFDVSPCGGTHVSRTGSIGVVEVFGVERYKGMMRVTFDAGPRARATLLADSRTLRGLAAELRCGTVDVATSLARLRAELKDARVAMRTLGARAAEGIARELAAERVVAVLEGGDRELLRAVAARLAELPAAVVVLGLAEADGLAVVVLRGASAATDCGATLKALVERLGGKGGGRADRAEGKLPSAERFLEVARELLGC
ncbi:MAG: alanyl-tRNA editing protein [Deltaproteobacteria bacterium]|nr:alanyl-tRNA editing protein [Deltaproteobacteria bacterium]